MNRAVRRTVSCPILGLPDEVLEKILAKLNPTLQEMMLWRLVCKKFNTCTKSVGYYNIMNPMEMELPNDPDGWQTFSDLMKDIYDAGNLVVLFLKGLQDYWMRDNQSGLPFIKEAADKGVDRAIYIYGMLMKAVKENHDEGDAYLGRLSSETRRRIIVEMQRATPVVDDRYPPQEFEYRDSTTKTEFMTLWDCPCGRRLNARLDWTVAGVKGPNMCRTCNWLQEREMFFRFLRHAVWGLPRMDLWHETAE